MTTRPQIGTIVGGTRCELASIPWEEYKVFPGLNPSVIVKGRKSLLHLKYEWEHGGKDTDAMQFGRMLHCLLFEPKDFERRYRAWDGTRRGKEYEAFCLEAEVAGAEVVRAKGEYGMDVALEAASAFLSNSRVKALIKAGKAEQTAFVPEAGLQCKGRLDWISTSEHILTDLKTATEIEARLFGQSFFRFMYDVKLGLYQRWLQRVTGEKWPVEIIVIENHPPYDVAVVPVPNEVLEDGMVNGLTVIESVKSAIETDTWTGVSGHEQYYPLEVPFWVMEQETQEFTG